MALRSNFSWMAISRVIYAFYQWLILAIIARFSTSEGLGEYTYALAVVSPIIIFSQLNLRAFIATDAKDQFEISDYIATRVVTIFVAIIAIYLMSFFFNKDSTQAIKLMFIVVAYKSVESISDIFYGVFQKHETMSEIAFSIIVRSVFGFFGMAYFILEYQSIIYGATSIAISWLLVLLVYDIPKSKVNIKNILYADLGVAKNIILTCFPLGIVVSLVSLRVYLPVYFIKMYHGVEAVGNFSVVSYFLVAGSLIVGALSQSTAPKLAKMYHTGSKRDFFLILSKLVLFAFIVGVIGVLMALFFGKQILLLLYGNSFENSVDLFVWIMVAGLIGYVTQFLGLALTVARKFKFLLFSNIVGMLILIVLSLYFIPHYGALGGAFSIVGVNLTVLLCNALFFWLVFCKKIILYKGS